MLVLCGSLERLTEWLNHVLQTRPAPALFSVGYVDVEVRPTAGPANNPSKLDLAKVIRQHRMHSNETPDFSFRSLARCHSVDAVELLGVGGTFD